MNLLMFITLKCMTYSYKMLGTRLTKICLSDIPFIDCERRKSVAICVLLDGSSFMFIRFLLLNFLL
jgi:hypothetical protein